MNHNALRALLLTVIFLIIHIHKPLCELYVKEHHTFKINNKVKETDEYQNKICYFYCTNKLGSFKIDIDGVSYNNHKIGDEIIITNGLTKKELYDYASNDYTRTNIIKTVKSNYARDYVSDRDGSKAIVGIGTFICIIFSIILFTFLIIYDLSPY